MQVSSVLFAALRSCLDDKNRAHLVLGTYAITHILLWSCGTRGMGMGWAWLLSLPRNESQPFRGYRDAGDVMLGQMERDMVALCASTREFAGLKTRRHVSDILLN